MLPMLYNVTTSTCYSTSCLMVRNQVKKTKNKPLFCHRLTWLHVIHQWFDSSWSHSSIYRLDPNLHWLHSSLHWLDSSPQLLHLHWTDSSLWLYASFDRLHTILYWLHSILHWLDVSLNGFIPVSTWLKSSFDWRLHWLDPSLNLTSFKSSLKSLKS